MHKRCLYVSAHLCSPGFPAAGHKLAAAKLQELAGVSEWVDVITFHDPNSPYEVRAYENVDYHLFNLSKRMRIIGSLRFPWLPIAASSRKLLAGNLVRRMLRGHSYDLIYVDFSQTLELIPRNRRSQATVRVHDIFSQLYRRQIGSASGPRKIIGYIEYLRVKFWEYRTLSQAGTIVALNEKDRDLLNLAIGTNNVGVAYPDPTYYVTDRTPNTIQPGIILFWGNMSRMENVDAVEYFVSDIFPAIADAVADARLVVAGAGPPQRILALGNKKINITGYIDDPGDLFRQCQFAIVPLRQGAGIKIKVLELIKSGIPVISTSIGAEGIIKSGLLEVHDKPGSFANACIRRLSTTAVSG